MFIKLLTIYNCQTLFHQYAKFRRIYQIDDLQLHLSSIKYFLNFCVNKNCYCVLLCYSSTRRNKCSIQLLFGHISQHSKSIISDEFPTHKPKQVLEQLKQHAQNHLPGCTTKESYFIKFKKDWLCQHKDFFFCREAQQSRAELLVFARQSSLKCLSVCVCVFV